MSGLAARFASFEPGRYLAGIWEGYLARHMYWEVRENMGNVADAQSGERCISYSQPAIMVLGVRGRECLVS